MQHTHAISNALMSQNCKNRTSHFLYGHMPKYDEECPSPVSAPCPKDAQCLTFVTLKAMPASPVAQPKPKRRAFHFSWARFPLVRRRNENMPCGGVNVNFQQVRCWSLCKSLGDVQLLLDERGAGEEALGFYGSLPASAMPSEIVRAGQAG